MKLKKLGKILDIKYQGSFPVWQVLANLF